MYLYYESPSLQESAEEIAAILPGSSIAGQIDRDSISSETISLCLTNAGLIVYSPNFKPFNLKVFYEDFILKRKKCLNKELLLQAINQKSITSARLSALDLTAGLGRDAILMALGGFQVTMVESNPYLALILNYLCKEFKGLLTDLQVIYSDNYDYLLKTKEYYDIVYLDPMFNDNKSALAKKDMQVIDLFINQHLAESCQTNDTSDSDLINLFRAAKVRCHQKILIKRDNKQSPLIQTPIPTYARLGKTIRFDVYQC